MRLPGFDGVAVEPGQRREDEDGKKQSKSICMSTSPGGSGTGQREEDSDEEFFGEGESGERRMPWTMDGGEVGKSGYCQDRVARPGSRRHGMENQQNGGHSGCGCDRDEDVAVLPMEVVTSSERAVGAAGVEQAVTDVDGPGSKGQDGGKPDRQEDVSSPGKGQGPDDGDGGGVKAG